MLVVIVTACLASNPAICAESRLPFAEDVSLIQCARASMPIVAAWSEEHPGHTVKRVRCTFAPREESPA